MIFKLCMCVDNIALLKLILQYQITACSNYLMLTADGPSTAESMRMVADLVSALSYGSGHCKIGPPSWFPPHTLQAVAASCSFVRTGGPLGITASAFLSRMLEIRSKLSQLQMLKPSSALKFSCDPLPLHN